MSMSQFVRTELLLGAQGLRRLRESFVLVCGLGAVGGYAVEGLARAGVGRLRLIDFDVVSESNLNRQLYALHSTIGQRKAGLARARVLDINPSCNVEARETFINADTIPALFEDGPDLLIDAIDSLGPKVALLAHAVRSGVPAFSSMGAALRRDPAKITFGDISETIHCPLARLVRKRLRRLGIASGVRCVYSTELMPDDVAARMDEDATPHTGRGRVRQALGSLPTLTGIFGLRLATAAIDWLATHPRPDENVLSSDPTSHV